MKWYTTYSLKNGFKFCCVWGEDKILDSFVNWCERKEKLELSKSYVLITDREANEQSEYKIIGGI